MHLSSAQRGVAITKHDSTNFVEGKCSWIHVGGAGVVIVVFSDGSTAAMTCVAGQRLDVEAIRVNDTSTTATLMVAMY